MPEDEDQGGPMFMTPDDMRALMHQRHDQMVMAGEAWRHEIRTFMHSLSESDLRVLAGMLYEIDAHENPANLASYWCGQISMLADAKFGVCVGCSTNHDEAIDSIRQEVHDDPQSPEGPDV